jgi:excisionase family DNA binding protein
VTEDAETLSCPEAGRHLGVSRMTAYRLAHAGVIPALRLARKLRVPVAALEEMLRTGRCPGFAPVAKGVRRSDPAPRNTSRLPRLRGRAPDERDRRFRQAPSDADTRRER